MQNEPIIIHTDGGSRGNPGPAACAFVAEENGLEIFKSSKYLGKTTNNTSVGVKLLRGATSILNPFELAATTASDTTVTTGAGCATFLDSPSTTSATTYKTQCWSSQNNAVVNVQSNGSYSTITLMEISA